MIQDYRDKCACVVDNGLFVHVAKHLAKSFGRVLYDRSWRSAFPKFVHLTPGEGIDGVERIKSFWNHLDEIDLFVFADLYYGPEQMVLRSMGKRVWGAGKAEELEIYRVHFKEVLKKLSLPVIPWTPIYGITALRKHLQEHENQFVKSSLVRGDCETFRSKNYELAEPKLDYYEHRWGAQKEHIELICEDAIEEPVYEVGYDGDTVDGLFAAHGIQGVEIKDECYAGHVKTWDAILPDLRHLLEAFAPLFQKYGYRGFMSIEGIKARDGTFYPTDPCMRCACPPSEAYMEAYANWPDRLWFGAEGKMIDPEPICSTILEVLLQSAWSDTEWQAFYWPKKFDGAYTLKNECVIDGRVFSAPQNDDIHAPGSVIALGDNDNETRQILGEACDAIEGTEVTSRTDQIDNAIETLNDAESNEGHD